MIIDSHQHFWKYNPVRDSWIDDSMEVLKKDFLPKNLNPILNNNGIDGCIAVQADQSEKETDFLLQLAQENDFIKGVIGWVDLRAKNLEERLIHYSKNKLFKGVRHIVQAETNDFMLRKDFQNGITKLTQFDLTFDVLIFPQQMEAAITLVNKFPNQKFIIDHMAKPNIKTGKTGTWKAKIIELSKLPNTYCKVSGMTTEANWNNWQSSDFTKYLDVVFKAFGSNRIMYGSDWPVCLLSSNYKSQLQIIANYISSFSLEEKTAILGGNAKHIYNL